MTMTLLEIVQEILSSLDSDEVNSISDNTESLQVATIVKRKYYDILARTSGLPEHKRLSQLTASSSSTPVLMYAPDGVDIVDWVKYYNADTDQEQYQKVEILGIEDFINAVNALNTDDDNVLAWTFTEGGKSFTLKYQNDRQPTLCAFLENYYVLFDAYDADLDSCLQTSKSMIFANIIPTFSMVDSFVPDLDDSNFSLLVNESKALAFFELKQTVNIKAEKEVSRQWSSVQKNQSMVNQPSYFDQLPFFGRR